MSFLYIKKKKAVKDGFKDALLQILTKAKEDSVEWVSVTAELVTENLPYFLKPTEDQKTTKLDNAVQEIVDVLKTANPDLVQPPLNFLPEEFQFFDDKELPPKFDLASVSQNFHFKPNIEKLVEPSVQVFPKNPGIPSLQKRKIDAAAIQQKLVKIGGKQNLAQKQGIKLMTHSNVGSQGASNVTASQRAVLTEILNSNSGRLSDNDRKLIESYLNGEQLKKQTETIIIAETTHKIDDSRIMIEQTKLRIDFKNRQIKKVKAVKRYRVNSKQ